MSKVVSVTNQKGGVGKTTTAVQLAYGLSMYGMKVLMIDTDPQCNASYIAGLEESEKSILDVIKGSVSVRDAIISNDRIDMIPGSMYMSAIEQYLPPSGREYALKRAIEPIRNEYDYIIIDTPPTLGVDTINVLTAADTVVIPAIADIFSLQGIGQLYSTINAVRNYSNKNLTICGILLTRNNNRLTHSRQIREMMEETASAMGTKVFEASIREAVAIREASTSRQSIFEYAPKSKQAEDYNRFLDEFLGVADQKDLDISRAETVGAGQNPTGENKDNGER